MRSPFFAELHQLLWFREFSAAKCFGETFTHTVIVYRPDIRAAKIEKEQHFNRPTPNAADGDQSRDDFFVGHLRQRSRAWHGSVDRFGSQIFDRGDLIS